MRRPENFLLLIGFAGLLVACATTGVGVTNTTKLTLLEQALFVSPQDLKQEADHGNARSQFSYALVLEYGLNGAQKDGRSAAAYREQALAARGTEQTSVYVPGTNNTPGHTQVVVASKSQVTEAEAIAVEQCVTELEADEDTPDRPSADVRGAESCAGPENFKRLRQIWYQTRHPS